MPFLSSKLSIGILLGFALTSAASAGDYADVVREDRPLAWWRFQDQVCHEGSAVKDENGRHPGIYHGVRLEAGVPAIGGKAARFDGEAGFVEVPHAPDFAMDELSVEFWFKATQPWKDPQWPGSATFLSKALPTAASSDWTINACSLQSGRDEGRVVASSGPAGGGSDTNTTSAERLNDGLWHHVAWSRGADGLNCLYVDGCLVDEAEDGSGSINNERPIQLGGDPHQRGSFLDGCMAEVAVYQGVLSAARVRAHAIAGGLEARQVAVNSPMVHKPRESLLLDGQAGLTWELWRGETGWSLGAMSLRGQPLELPATAGLLGMRKTSTNEVRWLPAEKAERTGPTSARLSGEAKIDDSRLRFTAEIAMEKAMPAARWTVAWSVDKDLDGWEVCLAPWDRFNHRWRCWLYPFAGNSTTVSVSPLRYCGVPAGLLYRPDLSMAALFGIDPESDYLNPTGWTGKTSFHFHSGKTAPQFRVGSKLSAGVNYRMPLQLILAGGGDSAVAVTQLSRDWIELNRYQVEPLEVRTPKEATAIFVAGRRATRMWQPGKGYQIQDAWPVIYVPESPINAYLDYLLYEQTGERLWRERAFQIMDFVAKAQRSDPADPDYGAIESHYNLPEGVFASTDRGRNLGLKPDMNAYAARYTLVLWQRVKQKEGLDRQDWRQMGQRIADWVVKQQRPDGGLPQVVGPNRRWNEVSVVSGRALVAIPVIRRITGEARYDGFIERHEQFVRRAVEGRFWFTGAHTDLPPEDFEADSVWQVVEYWLDKYDATRQREALERAEADVLLAFLMMCPKQLPWVRNPTQTCHAEQQHFLQYSNYCYTNAKIACLDRLAAHTGRELYGQLRDRIIQCGFWCQETDGPWKGSLYERMSDPWLGVSRDVNSKGTRYLSELAVDLQLQLLERGLTTVEPSGETVVKPAGN